jgi:hypothetical protein
VKRLSNSLSLRERAGERGVFREKKVESRE